MSRVPRPSSQSSFPRPPADLRGPLLAGAGLLVVSWLVLSFVPAFHDWLRGDLVYYENWGVWIDNHRLPYRDFTLEYPPGALPMFAGPPYLRKLAAQHGTYDFWFRVQILVIALLVLAAMAWALARLRASRRRAYAALCLAGVAPALLGPIALARYDYWPALLAVVGVAALVSGRPLLACVAFAVGAVAKVYPIVLVPFALFELWLRGRTRAAATGVGVSVVTLALGVLPFALLTPHGLWWAVHRQSSRPLQVESLGAAFFVAAHEIGGLHLHIAKGFGSDNILGHGPAIVATASDVCTVVALLGVYALTLRGRPSTERLVAGCAAAVTAYVAFTKVFSPQYLVWLIPLVPLVGGRRGLRAGALLAVVLGMTQIWEPYRYYEYYTTLTPWLAWLVVARDVLVVVLLGVLVWPRAEEQLAPAPAPAARSTGLAGEGRPLEQAEPL